MALPSVVRERYKLMAAPCLRRLGPLRPGEVYQDHLCLLLRVLAGCLGVMLELHVADGD
jgi:hypothetical protein